MPILEIQRLSKSFGDKLVLRNISLCLEKGEILALLGASGSGKTTLARVICGSIRPERGSVKVNGKEVSGISPDCPLSFMPQESGFWAALPVRKQLELALKSRRARFSGKEGVNRLAELGGLQDRLPAYPSELSGGELRRLAFLRAVAVKCDLLILDEPFISIDEATEARMQQVFRQYVEDMGCAVLLITHDFDHALLLAKRAAILHGGTIVQNDEPGMLVRSPAHGAVVRVLGEINIWPASIATDDALSVETSAGQFPIPKECSVKNTHPRIAYFVPTQSLSLGEGHPGICGTVKSAITGARSLRVTLQKTTDGRRVEIGLPLTSEILENVRNNMSICVRWPTEEGRLLDDC